MTGPASNADRRGPEHAGSVPARFVGAWRRQGLTIGGVPRDDADVLWLQAGSWYADLRIPHDDQGGPVEAFAGPAAWADPYFTWWHDLDWLGSFPEDVGHLEEEGADLVERGTFTIDGEDVPYRETWVRSSAPAPRLVAVGEGDRGRACVVQVADHAIGLADARRHGGGFAAWRAERRTEGWRTVFQRSIDEAPWPRIPLDHPWTAGERIQAGAWSLSVREAVGRSAPDFED